MNGQMVELVFWIFAWVITGAILLWVVARWHAPKKEPTLLREDYKFRKYERR